MKNITVVTVNYNSEESTQKFIDSIKKINKSNFTMKIIVVDNGSKYAFKSDSEASVMMSDRNTGFTGGCNLGIKSALKDGADYILLINNDTTVDSALVKNLIDVLEDNEKVGLVSPKIYFSKGSEFHKDRYKEKELGKVLWFAGGYIDWKNAKSIHTGMDEVDNGQYDKIQKIDFATGCCMMIKKEVFEKIGLFDNRYFLYYEDADLSERIIKAGFEINYVPKAVVYHDNAQSSGGSGSGLHDYFLTRNQMIFGMKYAPLRTRIALTKQSLRLLANGRKYQKKGIQDYYLRKFGKGSYFDNQT